MGIVNPIKANSLEELLLDALAGIVTILIPFIVIAVVLVGAQLVFTQAPDKIQEKKKLLLQLLVGVFIIFSAKGILYVVKNTTENIITDTVETAQVQMLI